MPLHRSASAADIAVLGTGRQKQHGKGGGPPEAFDRDAVLRGLMVKLRAWAAAHELELDSVVENDAEGGAAADYGAGLEGEEEELPPAPSPDAGEDDDDTPMPDGGAHEEIGVH